MPKKLLLALLLAGLGASSVMAQGSPAQSAGTLRAIHAIDEQTCWMVGDRGTVLRTCDGGATWNESGVVVSSGSQRSGPMDPAMRHFLHQLREQAGTAGDPPQPQSRQTFRQFADCRLSSVSFSDARLGWIAGGSVLPGEGNTQGLLLATTDGGASWNRISLPGSQVWSRIVRQGPLAGWGFGWPGHLSPGGQYETGDGGRNWSTLSAGEPCQAFVDGDRAGPATVAVSPDGRLWRLEGGRCEAAVILDRSAQPLRQVRMLDAQRGWAAGDRGMLLETRDGGLSWKPCAMNGSAAGQLAAFDLLALHVGQGAVWLAGTPGTCVFRLDPETGQIDAAPTGTVAALHAIQFVSRQAGWCAGQGGVILATTDGGRSWQIQRAGTAQLALLAVAFGDGSAPWELIARHALEDQYACGLAQVEWTSEQSQKSARVADAAARVGSVDVWTIRPGGLQTGKESSIGQLRQQLARLIRQVRPLSVATAQAELRLPDGSVLDGHAFLDEAVALAASERELPAEMAGGLAPWQVARVATPDLVGAGDWTVDSGVWLARRGRTIGDECLVSRAIVGQAWRSPPRQAWRTTAFDRSRGSREGLFAGLAVGPDRRYVVERPTSASSNLASLNRSMEKQAEMERLAAAPASTPQDLAVWRGQAGLWAAGADGELAGTWLAQLALACLDRGRLDLAVEAAGILVFGSPGHPLSSEAALWLARAVISREVHAIRSGIQPEWLPASGQTARPVVHSASPIPPLVPVVPGLAAGNGLEWSSGTAATAGFVPDDAEDLQRVLADVDSLNSGGQRAGGAPDWSVLSATLRELAARYPSLQQHPEMRMAEACLIRQASGWPAAESGFRRLASGPDAGPGSIAILARRELELAAGASRSPGAPVRSLPAGTIRPRLDGSLVDAVWQSLMASRSSCPVERDGRSVQADPGAEDDCFWMAADEGFLYFAGRLGRNPRRPFQSAQGPRERDALPSDRDQVWIAIDIDRDGTWPLWLAVSEQGQVADGIGETTAWNPQWFVATAAAGDSLWCTEGAIAWSQLGLQHAPSEADPVSIWIGRGRRPDFSSGGAAPGNGARSVRGLVPAASAVPSGQLYGTAAQAGIR